MPLLEDPYEQETVYVAQSKIGEAAGEGLYARKHIRKGQLVCLKNHSKHFSKDDESKYLILIPVEASYEKIVSLVAEQIGIGNPYNHEISDIFPYFPISSFKSVVASLLSISFDFFLKINVPVMHDSSSGYMKEQLLVRSFDVP